MTKPVVRGVLTGAFLLLGTTVGGLGSAAAAPIDYGALPVDPNHITDSTAYIADAPVLNPDGRPGVLAVFTHRDGSRVVTDTILDLDSVQAATDVLAQTRADLAGEIPGATTAPAPVGTDGTITSGMSADGSQAVAVLTFAQGDVVTSTRFQGPSGDPAPTDLIVDYGRMQADAIQAAQTAS